MLSLPVYRRAGVYYFHTRINGQQVKRSLRTSDPLVAKLRAVQLLGALNMHRPKVSDFILPDTLKKYEIDLASGKLRADSAEDHERMMQALDRLSSYTPPSPPRGSDVEAVASAGAIPAQGRLSLTDLAEQFFKLKSSLSDGTKTDYLATAKGFDAYTKNQPLSRVSDLLVTGYMGYLASKGNTPRTTDKKIGAIRALFNFAIKQKLHQGHNPAADRNLLTKKEKQKGGSKPFDLADIKTLFACEQFKQSKKTNPDFYWITVAGILTGIRVTALSSITAKSLKTTPKCVSYISIEQDKTTAGRRSVPVPKLFFDGLKDFLNQSNGFKYQSRSNGKGASDPVRKDLDRYKKAVGFDGKGLTFHSFRKTLNTLLMHEKVPFEVRCQFIGHEFDHVNKQVYGEQFSTDEIAEWVIRWP